MLILKQLRTSRRMPYEHTDIAQKKSPTMSIVTFTVYHNRESNVDLPHSPNRLKIVTML